MGVLRGSDARGCGVVWFLTGYFGYSLLSSMPRIILHRFQSCPKGLAMVICRRGVTLEHLFFFFFFKGKSGSEGLQNRFFSMGAFLTYLHDWV